MKPGQSSIILIVLIVNSKYIQMKTIKVPTVVYELLLEKSKKYRFRSVEQYLDALARGEIR